MFNLVVLHKYIYVLCQSHRGYYQRFHDKRRLQHVKKIYRVNLLGRSMDADVGTNLKIKNCKKLAINICVRMKKSSIFYGQILPWMIDEPRGKLGSWELLFLGKIFGLEGELWPCYAFIVVLRARSRSWYLDPQQWVAVLSLQDWLHDRADCAVSSKMSITSCTNIGLR